MSDPEHHDHADAAAPSGEGDTASPLAPRFTKETSRGVKRHLEFTHYRAEVTRKKLTRPVSLSEDQLQRIDGYLFHHVKTTITPRFLCLQKQDLRVCLATFVPTKAGGIPPDTTALQIQHVSSALLDDYYKYYKNLLNRMRHDIRAAMGELDPLFFSFPKRRGRDVRGRDKLDWYKETDDIAQRLDQVVNGGAEAGFRAQLLRQYQAMLSEHSMIEENITREEIKACSRSPYFYILAILAHHCTDLLDRSQPWTVDRVEQYVRPATEACIIHAWMLDLWDVTNDDGRAWSKTTFKNLIAFVERDRQTMSSGANREVMSRIMRRVAPHLPFLQQMPHTEPSTNSSTDDNEDINDSEASQLGDIVVTQNEWC